MLLVVSACGDKEEEEPEKVQSIEITEEELVDTEEVIATINETEILGSQYNPAYRERKELENFTVEPGEEIDIEKMKEITLDGLVGQELINQETEKLDINVTNEEIEEELALLKEQEGDMLDSLLEQFDWTEEDLKDQIKHDLTNNRYIEEKIEVEVTDEEAKSEYERVKEQSEDKSKVPDYAEVEDNIKLQMTQQKQNEELQKHIDKLKEKAEIEILI